MDLIATLIICILISFLFNLIAKKLRVSCVIALIFAGILIGSSYLRGMILEPNVSTVLTLGNIGLLALMFIAGLEVSWSMLYKEKRDAILVAYFAFLVPFLLGFIVSLILGFTFSVALVIGICMAVTAEATKARELLELGKIKTRLGSLILGAGIIDDILAMSLFVVVCYFFMGIVAFEEALLLMVAIAAFFVGVFVHKFIGREKHIIPYLEELLLLLVIPFFFIGIGLNFNLQALILNPALLLVIVLTAISGKISGVFFTKPFIKVKLRQLYLVGWAMNSRGAVELAIVFMAFRLGLLSIDVYSSLIVMTLVTTFIFPFIVRSMIRKNPRLMS